MDHHPLRRAELARRLQRVNTRNDVVRAVWDFLNRITEPVLRPIRSRLPHLGGIDVSPIIVLLIILLIQRVILLYVYPNVF